MRESANAAATAAEASITIEVVEGKKALEAFIRIPWRLYAEDPNWVPPLLKEIRGRLSPDRSPYFEHARARYWIARRAGQAVGRISAQIDELVAERNGIRTGHFGLIEAENDPRIFRALFDAAESWLRENGVGAVTGPFSLSVNQESGLLVDGFDTPPMILMGHALPYYGARIEELGYQREKDLLAYTFETNQEFPPAIQRLLKKAEQQDQITLRQLDMKHYHRELNDIIEIFNDAWSDNWGFIPLTDAEAKKEVEDMKLLIRDDLVYIAKDNGEPVGMMVTLPNLNEVIADLDGRLLPFGWAKLLWRLKVRCPKTGRVVMMGVRKKLQNTAMGAVIAFMLIEQTRRNAARRGIVRGELSWVLEDNVGMRRMLETIASRIYKTYRIYAKTLA